MENVLNKLMYELTVVTYKLYDFVMIVSIIGVSFVKMERIFNRH